MQRIIFEPAWDKTIAPADRVNIINLFNETKDEKSKGIVLRSIRQAKNHRKDLLAIVLVHNFSDKVFSFEHVVVTYFEEGQEIATEHFSFPDLRLKPRTSMPWTFIFPKESQLNIPTFTNGCLTLNN